MTTWHNITISVPEPVYQRARKWASHHNMSVSAVFTKFLQNLQYRPATGLAITPADAREIDAALARGIPINHTPWFLRENPYGAKPWNANDRKLHFRNVMDTLGQAVDWGPLTPPIEADSVKLGSCESEANSLKDKEKQAARQDNPAPASVVPPNPFETEQLHAKTSNAKRESACS